ncbi:MAG: radical SAM protein [PVC group bacterium]
MIQLLKNILMTDLGMRLKNDRLLRPVILHLTTTNRCNLKCQMCNLWKQEPKIDLPEQALINLNRSPLARGLQVLDITGGEPFLTDVERLIELAGGGRYKTVLFSSNGTLPDRTLRTVNHLIRKYTFALVMDISLDGLKDEHDRIRGVTGTFDRALETLTGLMALSRRHSNLKPTIKFTIMRDNYWQLLPVFHLSRELGAEFTTKPASEFGFTDNIGDKSYIFTPDETREIISQLEEIVRRQKRCPLQHNTFMHRIYRQAEIIFHRELIGYMRQTFIEKKSLPAGRCFSSFISILIHNDGKVYNCPTLLKPVGDLANRSFEEVWYGEPMTRIRRFIAEGKCACYSQCDLMPALVLGHKRDLFTSLFRRY